MTLIDSVAVEDIEQVSSALMVRGKFTLSCPDSDESTVMSPWRKIKHFSFAEKHSLTTWRIHVHWFRQSIFNVFFYYGVFKMCMHLFLISLQEYQCEPCSLHEVNQKFKENHQLTCADCKIWWWWRHRQRNTTIIIVVIVWRNGEDSASDSSVVIQRHSAG